MYKRLLLILCYFRIFSRNIQARYAENQKFLRWWGPVSVKLRNARMRFADRKTPVSYTHLDVYKRQIYDTMNYIKCDVSTICIGMAASMGAFLLSSGAKGKRYALPNAEIMIHQPSAGTQGQITDMAIHLKRLEIIKKRMNKILSENTGKPIEVVTADCERDNFMSAEEAVEYGLIDKVFDKH